MRLLLDTHILIWAAADELPHAAQRHIDDMSNTLLFSPASLWEIVIKAGLGRDDFDIDPVLLYNGLIASGYEEMPVLTRHVLSVASLPPLHKDPFDRILLAQAVSEGISFLTADKALAAYPGSVVFVG
ncbi:MAG: type II toxin-antitoxin system VapC family toxin [Clostridiales Family XIII bacterium]|jgi:PIN domain nuclease of toxin-antitoxin system|nr:type II toxin-antitoxin system VapC family toxin [Clostridiales Family XIII bacterium]